MLVCGKTMLIILILFVDSFLPLDCRAAIETMEIWPEDNEGSHTRFRLKPTRQLLWNNGWSNVNLSSSNSQDGRIFYIIIAVITLFVLLIKCCKKCAEDAEHTPETTTHLRQRTAGTLQPRPRTERATHVRQPSRQPVQPATSPGFIAAALSPTTMVLFQEDRPHEALFIGIENPNYRPSSSDNEQKNENPPPENELNDLPPSYNTVIQSECRFPTPASGNNSEHQKKDSSSLPLPKDY